MEYRREIDGLRALAVIPVILFHAGFEVFRGGFVGVDVFFVISGYLITRMLLAEMESGAFSIVNFYERRARRILPALFVVMAACMPFAWVWLSPARMDDFAKSLVAVPLFVSNVLFWHQSGYFDVAAELKPLLHTWSLAVEEQFYLLFPLGLMLALRLGRRWCAALLAIVGLSSLALAHWGAFHQPNDTFFLLTSRGWELAIGALTAFHLARARHSDIPETAHQTISVIGLGLIVFSLFAYSKSTPFPSLYALAPTLGAALIIVSSRPQNLVGRLLGSRAFVGIGLISYSAYLWHQPMFALARQVGAEAPGPAVFAALTLGALVLAALSWRFVEQPFRQKGVIGRKAVFSFAAAGSCVFVGIGMAGHLTDGFRDLRTNSAQKLTLASAAPSPKRDECHTSGIHYRKPQEACRFQVEPATWAVFGDSHSVELAYAMAETLRAHHAGIRQFSFSACPPSYGQGSAVPGCAAWTQEAVDYIAQAADIENVVVSYRIHAALFGGHEATYPALPDTVGAAKREDTWRALIETLTQFSRAGKKVFFVLQAPEVPIPVERLIMLAQNSHDIAGVSTAWWAARSAFVQRRIKDIPAGVTLIDPAQLFCNQQRCLVVKNGVSLYFDDDHPSVAGATLVARKIVESAYPANSQASPGARMHD